MTTLVNDWFEVISFDSIHLHQHNNISDNFLLLSKLSIISWSKQQRYGLAMRWNYMFW